VAGLNGELTIMKYMRSITKLTCTLILLTSCQRLDTSRNIQPSANPSPEPTSDQLPIDASDSEAPVTGAGESTHAGADLDLTPAEVSTSTPSPSADPQEAELRETIVEKSEAAGGDVWERVRTGFQLDQPDGYRRIDREVRWFVRNQDYLDRVAGRASRYLYHIMEEVNNRAMPAELALLPIVESAYDPFAYSHGRAMGLWQFIPSTGRLFGLQKNWWYDGRRDVQAATGAALDFLQELHTEFDGDWLLALAAYNSGAGKVRSAVKHNQRLGKPIDFWSLKLLPETRSYVPRLLAIARLVADPALFQVKFSEIPDQPYWVQVDTGSQIDLTLAARLAEISVEELYLLNPGFSRWATLPQGPHKLLIPVSQHKIFQQNLAGLEPDKRVGWQRHIIQPGENLGLIAWKYKTTVSTIQQANGLSGTVIRAGSSLLIPSALQGQESYKLSRDERLKTTQTGLQNKYGRAPLKYTVVDGDNLWDISRKHNISFRALAKWNGLATTDLLLPGTQLSIWSQNSNNIAILAAINNTQRSEVIRKVNYRVRKGESLSLIANKFNLSVKSIQKWNNELVGKRYIQPGQRLVLFVDVMQAE
jgi:membrane-bound lytic murein transglycosylase D